jgi:hypothetical protein
MDVWSAVKILVIAVAFLNALFMLVKTALTVVARNRVRTALHAELAMRQELHDDLMRAALVNGDTSKEQLFSLLQHMQEEHKISGLDRRLVAHAIREGGNSNFVNRLVA